MLVWQNPPVLTLVEPRHPVDLRIGKIKQIPGGEGHAVRPLEPFILHDCGQSPVYVEALDRLLLRKCQVQVAIFGDQHPIHQAGIDNFFYLAGHLFRSMDRIS